ncbi:MAG: hypothetical protein L0Y72_24375 [Gemmataceae bacterium]|nr:hypothetical protein [Gemmataceae bacterium]
MNQVIPKKPPLFSFRIDPKTLAETLLAVAELLPDESKAVQVFYYGDGYPLGFCAQNADNGMMIDALVVPFTLPKKKPTEQNGDTKNGEGNSEDAKSEEGNGTEDAKPKTKGRRKSAKKKPTEPEPEANGQPPEPTPESTPQAEAQPAQDATPPAETKEANGQGAKGKKSKKAKV